MKVKNLNSKRGMISTLWSVLSKKDKLYFVFMMFVAVLASFSALVPSQMVSIIISKISGTEVSIHGIKFANDISWVTLVIIGAVMTFLMKILKVAYDLNIEKLIKRAVANLRKTSYVWLITPRKNMDLKMTQGDAVYRLNQAPETISDILCDIFETILPSTFGCIIAFIYIIAIDLWALLIITVGIIAVIICVAVRTHIEGKIAVRTEKAKSMISSMLSNTITNLPIINLYRSMNYEENIFDKRVENYYQEQKRQVNLRWGYWTLVRFFETAVRFGVIFICALRVFNLTMSAGEIVVVSNYVLNIFNLIESIGYQSTRVIQAKVTFDRFEELKPHTQDLLPVDACYDKEISSLSLENVSAVNGKNFEISGINLKFKTGEMVVITGESGCGKTTLIRLICGLSEKTNGKIIANETDEISSAYSLTPMVSVCMQDAYIFNRDAIYNIFYPNGEYERSAKPLIKKLSMEKILLRKYDESVDQNFENKLSGGEKKRIGIARTLLKPAGLYIFDEPTNDLDSGNANIVISEIKKLKENAIVIVVSHDERVINQADRLIKFEKTQDNLVEILEVDK